MEELLLSDKYIEIAKKIQDKYISKPIQKAFKNKHFKWFIIISCIYALFLLLILFSDKKLYNTLNIIFLVAYVIYLIYLFIFQKIYKISAHGEGAKGENNTSNLDEVNKLNLDEVNMLILENEQHVNFIKSNCNIIFAGLSIFFSSMVLSVAGGLFFPLVESSIKTGSQLSELWKYYMEFFHLSVLLLLGLFVLIFAARVIIFSKTDVVRNVLLMRKYQIIAKGTTK